MRHVYFRISALLVSIIAMGLLLGSKNNPVPWHWLAWISVLFAGLSPWAQYFQQYFAGGGGSPFQWIYDLIFWQRRPFQGDVPFWWLAASTFVSAALGDTIWESSAMGYRYGAVGGFAHGMYYLGICIMFSMIFRMRTVHPHAQSLMQLVNACYGYEASGVFALLVLYRILSLVWTGALTTGLLFVEFDPAMGVFWGSILCGVSPLFYTLMGGIRSLYVAHSLQALILIIFLTVMLCQIPNSPNWISGQGSWTLKGGGDLIIVRLLQGCLSLPWVTAILTDRAFLSTPGTSLAAMLVGAILAYCFSFMSSLLGIHARVTGIGASPLDVGRNLGGPYYHLAVILTIINSMSVIDSCFVAAAKLGGLEAFGLLAERGIQETCAHPLGVRSLKITRTNVLVGRIFLMMVGGVGICCLASEVARPGSILLVRLSGVMTMGVGPPMILLCAWQRQWKRSPTAFWLPIVVSGIIGVLLVASTTCTLWVGNQCTQRTVSFASNWMLGEGDYAYELGLSVYSFLLAVLACITGFMLDNQFRYEAPPSLFFGFGLCYCLCLCLYLYLCLCLCLCLCLIQLYCMGGTR